MLRRALILIGYAAMVIIIITGTIILVDFGQGYNYNFKTGQFTLNGILDMVTVPGAAELYINGQDTHHRTPYRATLQTGSYDLELRRDGYQTWRKTVTIKPFRFLALDQILLLPTSISATNLTAKQTVTSLVPSSDRRHFAYLATGTDQGVWVLGGGDRGANVKVYTPQAATTDHPAETLQDVSWSADDSHLLIHSLMNGTPTYQVVAANGSGLTNLTDQFKLDLTGLRFSSYDWHELWWNSPDGLRKLNLNDKTASVVFADKVSGFNFANDRVLYVQTTSLGKSVWSMDRSGNNHKQLLESLPNSDNYLLSYANYSGRDILAVIPSGSSTLTVYLDIFSSTPVSKVISHQADQLSFSNNNRYLVSYNAATYSVYDFETGTLTPAPRSVSGVTSISWFDPMHLILNRGNEADLSEIDGDNLTKFATIVGGAPAYASFDGQQVYAVEAGSGLPASVYSLQLR